MEQWFDISAFTSSRLDPLTSGGKYGNAGRNIVRGPGFQRTGSVADEDLSGSGKGILLQFRAECFNFPNHPNFFIPENDVASPIFGESCRQDDHDCCSSL